MSEASSSDVESSPKPAPRSPTGKGKTKPRSVLKTPHGKNEGADPEWAFKPPGGYQLAEGDGDHGEFDWDALLEDEDVELWLMRVPEGVKPKNLDKLKLDVPSGSISKTARIGSVARKSETYDVWSVGDESNALINADEIKSMTLLAPRKRKRGKLFIAPKVPVRHIIVSAQPASPSEDPTSEAASVSTTEYQNPPRPSYPTELLRHRFTPFGSLASGEPEETSTMDVDADEPPPPPKKKKVGDAQAKKRKSEGDKSPRKPKKPS